MNPLLSFFCPIKNDWELFEKNLKILKRKLWFLPKEIVVFDDSSKKKFGKNIKKIQKNYNFIKVYENKKVKGISKGVMYLVPKTKSQIIAPFAADMEITSGWWYLKALLIFKKNKNVNLIFGKTKLRDLFSRKKTGVVGWSSKKNLITTSTARKEITSGKIRVAGGSVIYRKEWFLTNGGFYPKKNLGCLCDYYINHLAVLQGCSYYLSGSPATLYERSNSFSGKFKAAQVSNLLKMVIFLWNKKCKPKIPSKILRRLVKFEKTEFVKINQKNK